MKALVQALKSSEQQGTQNQVGASPDATLDQGPPSDIPQATEEGEVMPAQR